MTETNNVISLRSSMLINETCTECNACSLECLWWKKSHSCPLNDGGRKQGQTKKSNNDDVSRNCTRTSSAGTIANEKIETVFPLIVGCYQLVDDWRNSSTNGSTTRKCSKDLKHEDEKRCDVDDADGTNVESEGGIVSNSSSCHGNEGDNNNDDDDDNNNKCEECNTSRRQKRIGQLRTYTMKCYQPKDRASKDDVTRRRSTKDIQEVICNNTTSSSNQQIYQDDEDSFHFRQPQICHIDEGGVLDCKWCTHPITKNTISSNGPSETCNKDNHDNKELPSSKEQSLTERYVLASALSSGNIAFHELQAFDATSFSSSTFRLNPIPVRKTIFTSQQNNDEFGEEEEERPSRRNSFHSTSSSSCSSSEPLTAFEETICLSLDWSSSLSNVTSSCSSSSQHLYDDRLVSSYSNGQLVVHNVGYHSTTTNVNNNHDDSGFSFVDQGESSSGERLSIDLIETHRWNAHSLFAGSKTPSEVWTCCWAKCSNNNTDRSSTSTTTSNLIVSGGDDGSMKGWDLRNVPMSKGNESRNSSWTMPVRPVFCVGDDEFGAGVTSVAWHPFYEQYFVSGSYDEGVRLWDVRMLQRSGSRSRNTKPVAKIDSCGGGIWRLKFHPIDSTKLLVAAMHGGCCVLDVNILSGSDSTSITSADVSSSVSSSSSSSSSSSCTMNILSTFNTKHQSMAYGADWLPSSLGCLAQQSMNEHSLVAASCSFYDQLACTWKLS